MQHLGFDDKVGILDPDGNQVNPLTGNAYSEMYFEQAKSWTKLAIYQKSKELLESLHKNNLTFIVSSTGTGKSVIVPKLALHYLGYKGKVGMSLPKKDITSSTAVYAALTLDVTLGKEIGYIHKGSPKEMQNDSNRIIYMTDGSLIMKIVKDPLLTEYDCIIVDEAHERKVQIDMLLLFLKKIMEKRNDFRVIIMSATIDTKKYQNYFGKIKSTVINVSTKTNYTIDVNFLDHEPKEFIAEGLETMDKLIKGGMRDDMLFFITSGAEAVMLCRKVRDLYKDVFCAEAYSGIDKTTKEYIESKDKYKEAGNYNQKLIMATNVAESSWTIKGLKCVIDSCYELHSHYDPKAMSQVLEKKLITKAQALQRRGRVGRTDSGTCYHLITKQMFESLEPYPQPDILSQDVTMDLLKAIMFTKERTFDSGLDLINELMDVPSADQIDAAYNLFSMYKVIDEQNNLNKIGSDMSNFSALPLNRIMFIIYAYQLYCGREACAIIAMIECLKSNVNNLFYKGDTVCESGIKNKYSIEFLKSMVDPKGDHYTFLNIYDSFRNAEDKNDWAIKKGIRRDIMRIVKQTADKYYRKLQSLNEVPQMSRTKEVTTKTKIKEALKLSHRHQVAKHMLPEYPSKKNKGQISKNSVIHYNHDRSSLDSKKFIYDELTCINGSWEYNVITLIR